MKFYWSVYAVVLVTYLAYSTAWIVVQNTMPPLPKIIATGIAVLTLGYISLGTSKNICGKYWKGILLWPSSLFIWAFVVDAFIGTVFHGNPFYMSENTWPDQQLLVVVQNGYLYAAFKAIAIGVTFPLRRYIR